MAPSPSSPKPQETTTNGNINPTTIVSKETSDRVCNHMNLDHASSVYAMAAATLPWKERNGDIKHTKLQSVSHTGYAMSFVICQGKDRCEMRSVAVPFEPPLTSSAELKGRLVAIHHQALAPRIHWLVSDPLTLFMFIVSCGLGIATYWIGIENLPLYIKHVDWLHSIVLNVFGSTVLFAKSVKYSWYFLVIAHSGEALYGAYECQKTLKLKPKAILQWYLLIFCVGWFAGKRLIKLVNLQKDCHSRKIK